jgi:hypothetical protein
MNETRNAVLTDLHQLVDSSLTRNELSGSAATMTFGEISLTSLEAMNALIDESLVSLFGYSDALSLVAVGLLYQHKKQQDSSHKLAYQENIRRNLPELIVVLHKKLLELYEQIATDVEKHIESLHRKHIDIALDSLRQAQNLQLLKNDQASSYGTVFQRIIDSCINSNIKLDELRTKLSPASEKSHASKD